MKSKLARVMLSILAAYVFTGAESYAQHKGLATPDANDTVRNPNATGNAYVRNRTPFTIYVTVYTCPGQYKGGDKVDSFAVKGGNVQNNSKALKGCYFLDVSGTKFGMTSGSSGYQIVPQNHPAFAKNAKPGKEDQELLDLLKTFRLQTQSDKNRFYQKNNI